MDQIKYDKIWEKIRLIAHEIKNTCRDGTDVREDRKKDLFQVYNDLCLREGKGHIRESKSKSSVIAFDTVQMDRHKIAACMAGAILQVGILSEPENVNHNGRTMLS